MRRLGQVACVIAAVLAVLTGSTGSASDERPVVFGVLNQQSPALTAERWNPILHYVGVASGVPLQLRMGRTVQETDAMMGRGEYDFMFTNHNFQPEFAGVGYRVIARWAGEPIRGVIAVPHDSAIRRLEDLQGKRMAFPSRDAFVAYAVPMLALRQAGVEVEEVLGANQDGVLAQLMARRVAAAAVNSRFLARFAEREGFRVRDVYVSDAYPDLAVIAHPRLAAGTIERVRRALIAMKDDPAAAEILARAHSRGFEAASDRDYEGVRRVYRLIGQ